MGNSSSSDDDSAEILRRNQEILNRRHQEYLEAERRKREIELERNRVEQEAARRALQEKIERQEREARHYRESLQRRQQEENRRNEENLRLQLEEEQRMQREAKRIELVNEASRVQRAEAKRMADTMAALQLKHAQHLEEERQDCNVKMRQSYTLSMRHNARLELGLDIGGIKTNIALTGESGAGKSSLINGIRGLHNRNDEGYAAENAVQSKRTKTCAAYHCSKFPNIILHDTVGSNDENPTKSFFWDKKLYAYDYLLIVINNSVNEILVEIAKNAKSCCIPFAIVRTKLDTDIVNMADTNGLEQLNGIAKKSLRDDIIADFKKNAPDLKDVPFFMVSSTVLKFPEINAWKTMDEEALLKHIMKCTAP